MVYMVSKVAEVVLRLLSGYRKKRPSVIRLGSSILKITWSKNNRRALARECKTSEHAARSLTFSRQAVLCKMSSVGCLGLSRYIHSICEDEHKKILVLLNILGNALEKTEEFSVAEGREIISSYALHLGVIDKVNINDRIITDELFIPITMMHGDYLPKNLLVDEDDRSYLIDWEYGFVYGSLLYDIWKIGDYISGLECSNCKSKDLLLRTYNSLLEEALLKFNINGCQFDCFGESMEKVQNTAWRLEKNLDNH